MHELRPLGGRTGSHAPVDGAVVDHLRPFLDAREHVASEPVGIEIVEQARFDRPAQGDRRAAFLTELQRAVAVPRRHEVEHVVVGVLHTRALQVGIPVVDVHELGAALVGARRQGPGQLLLAEAAADVDDLAALDVRAEVDDQVGEAFESLLHEQAMLTGPRMGPRAGTACDRSVPGVAAARRGDAALLSRRRRGVRSTCAS